METQILDIEDFPVLLLHDIHDVGDVIQLAVRKHMPRDETPLAAKLPMLMVGDPVVEKKPALTAGSEPT